MKNYKDELENKIRKDFYLLLESYGVRNARVYIGHLAFITDVYLRELEAALAKKEGK